VIWWLQAEVTANQKHSQTYTICTSYIAALKGAREGARYENNTARKISSLLEKKKFGEGEADGKALWGFSEKEESGRVVR